SGVLGHHLAVLRQAEAGNPAVQNAAGVRDFAMPHEMNDRRRGLVGRRGGLPILSHGGPPPPPARPPPPPTPAPPPPRPPPRRRCPAAARPGQVSRTRRTRASAPIRIRWRKIHSPQCRQVARVSPTAVALVLAAAIAHASWNLFGKQAASTGAAFFIWLLAAWVTVGYLPVVAVTAIVTHPHLTGLNWLVLAGTGVLHAGSFPFLPLPYPPPAP